MTIIATDTDQVVICIRQERTNEAFWKKLPKPRIWQGCLEVERKEYTAKDILHLADDKPEDIVRVWRICMTSGQCDDVTDLVFEAADE